LNAYLSFRCPFLVNAVYEGSPFAHTFSICFTIWTRLQSAVEGGRASSIPLPPLFQPPFPAAARLWICPAWLPAPPLVFAPMNRQKATEVTTRFPFFSFFFCCRFFVPGPWRNSCLVSFWHTHLSSSVSFNHCKCILTRFAWQCSPFNVSFFFPCGNFFWELCPGWRVFGFLFLLDQFLTWFGLSACDLRAPTLSILDSLFSEIHLSCPFLGEGNFAPCQRRPAQ